MPHTNLISASAMGVPSAAAAAGGELAGTPPVPLAVHRNVLDQLDAANERIDSLLPANFELREMLGETTNAATRCNEHLREAVSTIEELAEKLEKCKRELNARRSAPGPDLSALPGEPLRTYVWRCPHCGDPFNRDEHAVCQTCGFARPASTGGGRHTKKRRTRRRRKRRRKSRRAGMRDLNIRPGALFDAKTSAPPTGHFFNLLQKKKHGAKFPSGVRDPKVAPRRSVSPNRKKNEELFRRIKAARNSTGGRRRTRRRRRKRRQRRTRRGGDSPLHIRRRLLALSTRIRQLKRRLWDKHRKARAKAKATANESAFVHDPKSGHIVQRQNI